MSMLSNSIVKFPNKALENKKQTFHCNDKCHEENELVAVTYASNKTH